jgi:hypothetical protein
MNKIITTLATLAWGKKDKDDDCDHDWVPWSGKQRCRKCGATAG